MNQINLNLPLSYLFGVSICRTKKRVGGSFCPELRIFAKLLVVSHDAKLLFEWRLPLKQQPAGLQPRSTKSCKPCHPTYRYCDLFGLGQLWQAFGVRIKGHNLHDYRDNTAGWSKCELEPQATADVIRT